MRRFLFGGARPDSPLFDFGVTSFRVFAGLVLALFYGMMKFPPAEAFVQRVAGWGFPFPPAFAWASTLTEVVGGVLLAIGLFTRPVAVLILVQMTVVLTLAVVGTPFRTQLPALHYVFIGLLFLCIGGGRWSVDNLLRDRE